jgi:hypothetical protein
MENTEETPLIVKKTETDISYREAEIKEKLRTITLENKKHRNEEVKTSIEKVKLLQNLIEGCSIDEDKQVIGCEIVLKNTFNEGEIYTLKNKIFEIIKTF